MTAQGHCPGTPPTPGQSQRQPGFRPQSIRTQQEKERSSPTFQPKAPDLASTHATQQPASLSSSILDRHRSRRRRLLNFSVDEPSSSVHAEQTKAGQEPVTQCCSKPGDTKRPTIRCHRGPAFPHGCCCGVSDGGAHGTLPVLGRPPSSPPPRRPPSHPLRTSRSTEPHRETSERREKPVETHLFEPSVGHQNPRHFPEATLLDAPSSGSSREDDGR